MERGRKLLNFSLHLCKQPHSATTRNMFDMPLISPVLPSKTHTGGAAVCSAFFDGAGGGWKRIQEKYNYEDLKKKVAAAKIPGRSKLTTKDQMAAALREHYEQVGERIRRQGGNKEAAPAAAAGKAKAARSNSNGRR